jgi:hypothetical protein
MHSIGAALTIIGLGISAIPASARAQSFGDPGFTAQGGGAAGVNFLSVAGDFWDQVITGQPATDGIALDLAFATTTTSPILVNVEVNGNVVDTLNIAPGDTSAMDNVSYDPSLAPGPSVDVTVVATTTADAGGLVLATDGSSTIALTPVSEPASMVALLAGIGGIFMLRRRHARKPATDNFVDSLSPAPVW